MRFAGKISLALILLVSVAFTGCKSQAVKNCESRIEDIGRVSLDSHRDIEQASEAYEALSSAEQSQVSNYEDLMDAEVQYVELMIDEIGTVNLDSAGVINEAREAYDDLDSELQEEVSNFDELEEAEDLIAIVDITGTWTGTMFGVEVTYVFNDDGTMYNYSNSSGFNGTASGTYSFDGSTITLANGQSHPAERTDENTLVITASTGSASVNVVLTRQSS